MFLFLVHHAEAAEPSVDPQRPLTPGGRMHADNLAIRARDRGVKPAVIWHSGKLRARQTAEAFWRTCNPLAELSAIPGLQPTDPPHVAVDRVTGDPRDIMLVGHFPGLPKIYAVLVGTQEGDAAAFPLHGLVALQAGDARWIESWRLA
jgi:phosphohistidine phosphatase